MEHTRDVRLLVTFGVLLLLSPGCSLSPGQDPGPGSNHDLEPVCGNGSREESEVCDGGDFGGETCLTLTGHTDGELLCSAGCGVDTSACHTCGNRVLEGDEECEEGTVFGRSCAEFGYQAGSPYCDGCRVAGCYTCGDGTCDSRDGESALNCAEDCGGWLALAAGDAHTCAVTQSGDTLCWGADTHGQLGRGGTARGDDGRTPAAVLGLDNAISVTAGLHHTCALRYDGQVFCWGSDLACQLGLGAYRGDPAPGSQLRLVPTPVPGLDDVLQISAGADHSCAVRADGTVWCWGGNYMGQLGDGSREPRCTPTRVHELAGVEQVSAGHSSTCAVTADGQLWCWGANDTGQLGVGMHTGPQLINGYAYSDRPQRVMLLDRAEEVSVGLAHGCVVNAVAELEHSVNEVWCWGRADAGQLGDGVSHASCGEAECSDAPVHASLGRPAKSVSVGAHHSCAAGFDSRVYCWGANDLAQLGDGGLARRSGSSQWTPVAVEGIVGLRLLAVGSDHACVVTADRSIWCWGANESGQAGGEGSVVATPLMVFDSSVR